ncbi:MAG: response regulator [Bacteroidota bacterium]
MNNIYTEIIRETPGDTDDSVLKGARILIIDDSETNIKVLGALLKRYECEVLTALDPERGLSIAEAKLPDLILLDVLMPEMDGFETHALLKKNQKTSHIPVIYLTAASKTQNVIKGIDLGAVDYITKPFNHAELIARVRNRLKLGIENERVKMMFESKSHSFITLNHNLEITGFNTSANERSILFKHDQLKFGENALNYVDAVDRNFVRKRIESALNGRTVEFEKGYVVGAETKWFNYIIEPIKNKNNAIVGCILSATDITAKKDVEMEDADYLKKINDVLDETQQSLRYASYIQNAIFPNQEDVSAQFAESFIFFKPKEKVSGDFYWTCDLGDKSLLILGDCTGHGVPGALLTTISIVLLERIVKYQQIYSPEKILTELNSNIVNTLNQKDGGIKDGLEMAVCLFDKTSRMIEFAGAKRSLLLAKNKEVIEIKGNRQEIGGEEIKAYSKQQLYPEKGTMVYITSDGYADQIGGDRNKKFMKKNLKKLIISLNGEAMDDQKLIFADTINTWKGYEEQTDDILLIGVRV